MAAQLWPLLMLDVGRPFRDAHCFVPHTEADVSTPVAEQSIGPDTPYPVLHVGWHCAPAARALVHEPLPRLPLVGAAMAHGAYVGEAVSADEGAPVQPVVVRASRLNCLGASVPAPPGP